MAEKLIYIKEIGEIVRYFGERKKMPTQLFGILWKPVWMGMPFIVSFSPLWSTSNIRLDNILSIATHSLRKQVSAGQPTPPIHKGGGVRSTISEVIADLKKVNSICADEIDNPVFSGESPRPDIFGQVFQRLGFSNPFKWIP